MSEFLCNLCEHDRFIHRKKFTKRLKLESSKFKIVKCNKCGLHSLYPIPNDEELKLIYDNYAEQNDRISREKLRIQNVYPNKIKKIRKYIPKGERILDIGAGIGGFASVAKKEGFQVTAIEFEMSQVKIAKELFDVDLICDSFESFDLSNKIKYDVVHLHHVLEHLRYPKDTLSKITEILTEDGILLFEIPNQFFNFIRELKRKVRMLTPPKIYNPYHHIYFFSPGTLSLIVQKSGYEILEFNQLKRDGRNIRRQMCVFLARIFKMGISSKIEVVARVKN